MLFYYPEPEAHEPITAFIQPDATMEDVIGFSLYAFERKHGRLPTHPFASEQPEDILKPRAWVLRMVEDGVVDDDYPPIDYGLVVGQFGEHEFALCAAASSGIGLSSKTRPDILDTDTLTLRYTPASTTSSQQKDMLLQIMVVPTASGLLKVRVPMNATIYQVIEQVCEQCQLGHPSMYALLCRDADEILPLSRIVAQCAHTSSELVLVERTSLKHAMLMPVDAHMQPVLEEPKYKTAMDIISNYKVSTCTLLTFRRTP